MYTPSTQRKRNKSSSFAIQATKQPIVTPCIQILSKYKQYSLFFLEFRENRPHRHCALKYTTIYEYILENLL